MSDAPASDEISAALNPVWYNADWVTSVLGVYEGISKHADQLNINHSTFFGITGRLALDAAAIGICKLYDTSNPNYKKDTVPALFDYFKAHVDGRYAIRLKLETLSALGIAEAHASQIAAGLKHHFDATKFQLFRVLEELLPTKKNDTALFRLMTYRNKIATHQERLKESYKESLESLPSLYDMERLNHWATNLCVLAINLLTPNVAIVPHGRSSRIATLTVAAKLLNKQFSNEAERVAFFSRIE